MTCFASYSVLILTVAKRTSDIDKLIIKMYFSEVLLLDASIGTKIKIVYTAQ